MGIRWGVFSAKKAIAVRECGAFHTYADSSALG